jgi:hypothetical protein
MHAIDHIELSKICGAKAPTSRHHFKARVTHFNALNLSLAFSSQKCQESAMRAHLIKMLHVWSRVCETQESTGLNLDEIVHEFGIATGLYIHCQQTPLSIPS